MRALQPLLRKFLNLTTKRPWITIAVALALAALSILYTVRNLDFETSQLDLISPKHRLIKLTDELNQFNDLNPFTVVIEAPTPERAVQFLKALVLNLQRDRRYFKEVFYRVDWAILKKWSLLYLDNDELATLRSNLSDHLDVLKDLSASPGLNKLLFLINREMTSKMIGHLFTDFLEESSTTETKKKPLDLSYLIGILQGMENWLDGRTQYYSPWGAFFGKSDWEGELDSYFWTSKKKYLLAFVRPQKIGNAFTDKARSLQRLRQQIKKTLLHYPDVRVGVTGQEALNMDQMSVGLSDMTIASILSAVGLTLLLILFWRSVRKPLLEMTELLLALSWTFGLTTLFIGHLNILSMIFAPLLLGLGIDYGIHWLARYEEALKIESGQSTRETIVETMAQVGPAVLVAGVTAALSFVPLALTDFKGLKELGIISAMGMIMTTITTLGVLPSLVLIFEKRESTQKGTLTKRHINTLIMTLTPYRTMCILSISLVLTVLSLIVIKQVHFNLNLLQLQPKGTESVDWEMKLIKNSKRSALYAAVLANSPTEVLRKQNKLKNLPVVSETKSIFSYLPENQDRKIPMVRELKPLISEISLLNYRSDSVDIKNLLDTLGSIRFKMLPEEEGRWGANKPLESQMIQVRNLIETIRTRITANPATAKQSLQNYSRKLLADLNDKLDTVKSGINVKRPMTINDLPKYLVDQYVGKHGKYMVKVYPKENVWEAEPLAKFVKSLRRIDPDVIGDPVTLYVFTRAFRKACIQAAIYAVVFIFVLLLFTFRSLTNSLLAMTPLFLGTLWTTGLMWCFGVNFNLANSIFLPLIVGAGVEYGIVILNRWFQEGTAYRGLPSSTGKGIILAALTTTVGFGSLMISHHRGINSLGMLATIGSITVMAAAVIVLPAMLYLCSSKTPEKSGSIIPVKVNLP